VLVRVGHAGVNYRDVLMATGCYPGQEEEVELGWECAGTVAAVGDGVAGLPLGARVLAAAPASLGTHVVADARLVHPYPDRLSEAEAAGVPIAYLTAYYGLHVLGRLREGERVLVHSATGGVGLAAIRIARWRGAEVFATAGSSEKRAWLRMIGVQHVGDSRTTEFATEILAATRGHGVDVVLNTLAGAAIEANLAVLAPYGRHIDLARRDIVDNSPLGLAPLAKHLTLTAFDVTALLRDRPAEAGEALAHVLALIGAGVLDPVPHETRPVDRAPEAFRRIAAAQHTGKIVLDLNGATARSPHVRPDGTYLVTGGHGGLGREVSRWLLDSGARHVVLLGRTASTEPEPAGVSYEALDVADTDALRALLRRRAEAGLPALRGVVHAAGVIDYTPLDELTGARLSEVLHPKVAGGWALHRATDGAELDFFVLFSSGAAVLGSPRLGAYAAANAFLDGLARRRRLAGLPATSVGWGFWSGTGMVHRYEREHGRSLVPSGFGRFDAATGFTHLRTLLDRDAVQAAVLTADWPRWAAAHPDAARDPLLRELLLRPAVVSPAPEPVAPAPVPLRTPTPAGDVLTGLVGAIATVMSLPPDQLDLDRPLNSQGFDSLMAGQVRAAVRRDLGVLLPITRMLSGRSVRDLASGLRDGLAPPDPGEA
jgi:NADPH:quinone reductase-like Zn-dependent oxidoreductase